MTASKPGVDVTGDGASPVRRTPLQRWLRIDPASRAPVYRQVHDTTEIRSLNYWLGIVLSAGIATLGLIESSPAVIIGAMLISPLMGPIMATGMGIAVGDLYLTGKAVSNLLLSVALAILLSAALVWLVPFHSPTSEILARTNPTLLDLGIALLSGLAGSIAVVRSGGGDGQTTLPGVAIAVALMPPLCTVGFGLGSGLNLHIMGGALLLFVTNLVAITASAFAVFVLVGMGAPDIRAAVRAAHAGDQSAMGKRLGRTFTEGTALHWRIVMLMVLLAAVGWPLESALRQLAGEAVTREAVQTALKKLVPAGTEVSRQVEVGRESVAVRLVATAEVAPEAVQQAEKEIAARAHRRTRIVVATVANQSEIAQLMQKLATPQPTAAAPAAPQPLGDLRTELSSRVQPALQSVWPTDVPVESYSLSFTPDAVTLQVQYTNDTALSPLALQLLERDLRTALASPTLRLTAERVRPAAVPRSARRKR